MPGKITEFMSIVPEGSIERKENTSGNSKYMFLPQSSEAITYTVHLHRMFTLWYLPTGNYEWRFLRDFLLLVASAVAVIQWETYFKLIDIFILINIKFFTNKTVSKNILLNVSITHLKIKLHNLILNSFWSIIVHI